MEWKNIVRRRYSSKSSSRWCLSSGWGERFSSRTGPVSTVSRKTSSPRETLKQLRKSHVFDRFEGAATSVLCREYFTSFPPVLVATRGARLASKERKEIILDPSTVFLWFYPPPQLRLVSRRKERWLEETSRRTKELGWWRAWPRREIVACVWERLGEDANYSEDNETRLIMILFFQTFDTIFVVLYFLMTIFILKSNLFGMGRDSWNRSNCITRYNFFDHCLHCLLKLKLKFINFVNI